MRISSKNAIVRSETWKTTKTSRRIFSLRMGASSFRIFEELKYLTERWNGHEKQQPTVWKSPFPARRTALELCRGL